MTTLIRKAIDSDFSAFHQLQSGAFRKEVFATPPEDFDEFFRRSKAQIEKGVEHYFSLVENDLVTGFVWFQHSQDLWFTLLWGPWLRTLVYAAGITGFRILNFPRQHFWIRQKNRRMIKVADDPGYGFRKVGEDTGYALSDEDAPLVVVRSSLYEILSTIYFEQEDYYRKQSKELVVVQE